MSDFCAPFCAPDSLYQAAADLAREASAAGLMLCTAESCTGGLIAATLTDIPGSSAFVWGGFVTYSNAAKTASLGVPEALLEAHGAVSAEVAAAMATGALAHSGADVSVAVTGIAGPGGGSADKPVGTVWFGFARKDAPPRTECHVFAGGRAAVRTQTVAHALKGLRALIAGEFAGLQN